MAAAFGLALLWGGERWYLSELVPVQPLRRKQMIAGGTTEKMLALRLPNRRQEVKPGWEARLD